MLSGLIVEILNKIAPLIIIHVAQKRLGIEKLGYALFGISVIELVIPFILYGYNQYGVIAAGRNPRSTSKLMSGIFILKICHFLILLGCLLSFFRFVPAYQIYFPMMLPLSVILGFSILDTIWVQSASQKVTVSNVFIGICRLVTLLLIVFFIKNSQDAVLFAILSLVGNALVNVFSTFYSVLKFGLVQPDWSSVKSIFKASTPYSVIVILNIVMERMDIFFAEHFGGLAGAGYYASTARLSHSLSQIANTIIAAFFSEMVVLSNQESLSTHLKMSTWMLLFFLSPIVFGVWFVSGDILNFIFDESFRSVENLLGWLFLSTSFLLLATSFGQQVLLLRGQVKVFAIALASGIVLSSILTYFVGSISLNAIAIAMCAGKFLTMLIVIVSTRKSLGYFPFSILLKTTLPGLIMSVFLYLLHLEHFLSKIAVGALIFFISGYFLNQKEFSMLFSQTIQLIRRRK